MFLTVRGEARLGDVYSDVSESFRMSKQGQPFKVNKHSLQSGEGRATLRNDYILFVSERAPYCTGIHFLKISGAPCRTCSTVLQHGPIKELKVIYDKDMAF